MIAKRRYTSTALELLGERERMTKPDFVEEKLKLLEKRGVKIHWLHPRRQVMEELIKELPKVGVNRYIADQAAREIYNRIEIGIDEKGGQKIRILWDKGRPNKGEERRIREMRERSKKQGFYRMKKRLESRVAREMENSIKTTGRGEEEVVRLVKLTRAYRLWVDEHGLAGAEDMAREIARDLKKNELARRDFLEKIRTH